MSSFGEYLKELRVGRRMTLRAFCEASHQDPGNYSKLERGRHTPPTDPSKLEPFRKALGLDQHSPEWRELLRLAALEKGRIPAAVLSDGELVGKLPALFRTLEGDPVDDAVLDELIAVICRAQA